MGFIRELCYLSLPALATYASATDNEVGIATTAGTAAALTPQSTSYTGVGTNPNDSSFGYNTAATTQ
jgi:hypothetical protein